MNKINITSTFFVVMMVQQLAAISLPDYLAPLQAGYGYTKEEKDNAREEIARLEGQQAVMLQQYNEIKACQDLSKQEKDEHLHSVASSMYRLNEDIKALQLITGDAWSDERKRVWGIVAFIAAGLAYKFFGLSIVDLAMTDDPALIKLRQKKQKQNHC